MTPPISTKFQTAKIVAVTAGWIGVALVKNGFLALVDVFLEKQNRKSWRNRNALNLNQG